MQPTADVPRDTQGATAPVRPRSGLYRFDGARLPVYMAGQEVQLFRVGPLYDRFDGSLVATITDELCAEMVRVFDALTAEGVPCPIDWNHGTEMDVASPAMAVALGRITAMRHEPGVGLWGSPVYTEAGEKLVTDSGGALWTSPAFLLGAKYDGADDPKVGAYSKRTGERIGDCQITSVALTPSPRQDSLSAVLLSDRPPQIPAATRKDSRMDANTSPGAPQPTPPPVIPAAEGAPAAEPTKAAESPEEMAAKMAALQAELEALKAENAALKAQVSGASESSKALAETRRELTLLGQRLAKAEADASAEKLARELDAYQAEGLFAPARREYFAELARTSRKLFSEAIAHQRANPEVPMGQRGHSAAVDAPKPKSATQEIQERAAVLLSEGKAKDLSAAYAVLRTNDPALFSRAGREG